MNVILMLAAIIAAASISNRMGARLNDAIGAACLRNPPIGSGFLGDVNIWLCTPYGSGVISLIMHVGIILATFMLVFNWSMLREETDLMEHERRDAKSRVTICIAAIVIIAVAWLILLFIFNRV